MALSIKNTVKPPQSGISGIIIVPMAQIPLILSHRSKRNTRQINVRGQDISIILIQPSARVYSLGCLQQFLGIGYFYGLSLRQLLHIQILYADDLVDNISF